MAELVYAAHLKCADSNVLWVQVPLTLPRFSSIIGECRRLINDFISVQVRREPPNLINIEDLFPTCLVIYMSYSKKKCSDEELIKAANEEITMARAAVRCGLNFKTFRSRAKKLGVYQPNPAGRGTSKPNTWKKIPTEEILKGKHPHYQTYKLRNRLIKENLLDYECASCGISEWNGSDISLELDHIDGTRANHRIENLRLLCPNCHSQTSTFRSKNRKRKKKI